MRIAYFGVPIGARRLHDRGHTLVAACLGPLDLPGRRWARRALRDSLLLGLPDLRDRAVQRALASTRPQLVLSFFWPRKIPTAVLDLAPAYGTHPSLLPRWRGPDPTFWAIRSGDAETGVTLHTLEAEYDTGGVVAQRRLTIDANDTAWSLSRRLDRPALAMLCELADEVRAHGPPEVRPQEGAITHAPFPSPEQLAIDWREPLPAILRLIRAAAPFPGATANLAGHPVDVVRASATEHRPPAGLAVAEAWRTPDGWAVRCQDGALRLDEVRDDDGPVDLDRLFGRRPAKSPSEGSFR